LLAIDVNFTSTQCAGLQRDGQHRRYPIPVLAGLDVEQLRWSRPCALLITFKTSLHWKHHFLSREATGATINSDSRIIQHNILGKLRIGLLSYAYGNC